MVGRLILLGLVIGIAAGLLSFGWARTFGEAPVQVAIDFESAHHGESAHHDTDAAEAGAGGHADEEEDHEIFSRTVQSGIGLLTGLVVVGAGLGCLFAVLFALANGRMGLLGPGPTSALLALLGLISVFVIPALKYPPNPPAVGDHDTIKFRTGMYFLLMAISIAATVGATIMQRRLTPTKGIWNATVSAGAAYLVVIAATFLLLPTINEVPGNFPAATLWDFRLASFGVQAVLWGSIGVLFGCVGEWWLNKPAR